MHLQTIYDSKGNLWGDIVLTGISIQGCYHRNGTFINYRGHYSDDRFIVERVEPLLQTDDRLIEQLEDIVTKLLSKLKV